MSAVKNLLTLSLLLSSTVAGAAVQQTKGDYIDKFRQLDEELPTPNVYRNAAGEPGQQYWQQQVDYQIKARLDESKRRLSASQQVTYRNNSPYTLKYLWLQLDQNVLKNDSMAEMTETFGAAELRDGKPARISLDQLRRQQFMADTELGYSISKLASGGKALRYVVVGTQMRIDLPTPLKPGQQTEFTLDYAFNIAEEDAVNERAGYEHFPDDARKGGNDIFLLAQWFPRLVAYTDYEAWTNKEFLGQGEFTLEFGDYDVALTVPADHIVSSTGVLQNPADVLTATQRQRLEQAKTAKRPVQIVTPAEALDNEKDGSNEQKTWRFKADNVRDFAWASSRKFIWDAKGYQQGGNEQPFVMAMSFYPKEGGELWQKYSTEAVIHTMQVYSRFAFDYQYPVAQSVNGPVGGMEYPMITFNGPRTELQKDGSRTYSLAEKLFLVGVVIHEVGHIYFPMVVNSDERQWTWMDEGINSFLDAIAGREWDPKMPWGVEARDVVDYMKGDQQEPIMTQSDSVTSLGPNAYTKPAVALGILRDVILGRELFDFAFREYATRWKFKRPTPADFFRTMEEASGVDLDWFWRGWFYSTDHVDIALEKVYKLRLDTEDPDIDMDRERQQDRKKPASYFAELNVKEGKTPWVDNNKDVTDFYDKNDQFTVTNKERNSYQEFLKDLKPWERRVLDRAVKEDKNYYVLQFRNLGGLVMPILLQLTYEDGSTEQQYIAAEIWRQSPHAVSKLLVSDKKLVKAEVDPKWLTADVDVDNNVYPRQIIESRIESFKREKRKGHTQRDIMQDSKTKLKSAEDKDDNDGQQP